VLAGAVAVNSGIDNFILEFDMLVFLTSQVLDMII